MRTLRVLALALCALLAGCVPTIETILKPEVLGGRLIGATCRGGDGPREVAVFDHGGISIEVVAYGKARTIDSTGKLRDEVNGIINVRFLVPEGVTFFLRSSTFELLRAGERFQVAVTHLSTFSGKKDLEIPFNEKMVGSTRVSGVRRYHAAYRASVRPSTVLGPRFSLRLPGAVVNGTQVDFPEISFTETTVPAFHFLNC